MRATSSRVNGPIADKNAPVSGSLLGISFTFFLKKNRRDRGKIYKEAFVHLNKDYIEKNITLNTIYFKYCFKNCKYYVKYYFK